MGTTLRLRLRYVPIQYKTNSKKMIIFETKFNLHYTLLGILPNLNAMNKKFAFTATRKARKKVLRYEIRIYKYNDYHSQF